MNTEGMIKHEMVVQTLQWGLNKLRAAQISQLNTKSGDIRNAGFNWDELMSGITGRNDAIIGSNGHYRIIIPVDKKLRFADMKRLGSKKGANAAVYNRPTWGVLFGRDDSVRTRLRQGISDSAKEAIMEQLKETFALKA